MTKFSNFDDVIDSRDIIERIEELEGEREALQETINNMNTASAYGLEKETEAIAALAEWDADNLKELQTLQALASEAEHSSDWSYGETLINETYFTDYIEQLIDECYEMPKQMNSDEWPYRHVTIDYEAAAEEAKADYSEVNFDGVIFLIRA